MKTANLSNGERIVVQRRRAEQSQRDAAAEQGVSLYRYRRWENDEDDPPRAPIGVLAPHEGCFIHRRRAGVPLQTLADELEISRWWLCQMEYGRAPVERLVAHWAPKDRPWRPTSVPKTGRTMSA